MNMCNKMIKKPLIQNSEKNFARRKSGCMKKKVGSNTFGITFFLVVFFLCSRLSGQSIVAVQDQAGFVMCTKTGEIFVVNANTGTAKLVTTAPSPVAINSLATDTSRGIIYYCYNNFVSTNKAVYGYNYRTNTHFTLINDFSTAPGGPMLGLGGVGTAGAAFYNGHLYFGVELARNLSPGVPNIGANVPYSDRLYRVTLDATGTSITATSLVKDYYTDNGYIHYNSTAFGSPIFSFFRYDHNWGDFVIINDTLFDRAVKGYTSGSFWFEQTTVAYKLSTPAIQSFNTLTLPATTVLNDGFSYVQTASDGLGNLIFVGNEGNTNQFFVVADKTNGSYNVATAKPLTVNGAPFAKAVTDCGNVIKGEGVIGDKVWFDINENGIKDGSEIGLQNVPVELWEDVNSNGLIDEASDKLLGTAITAADGSYGFINMLQGNYLVRCVLSVSVNYPALGFSASYPTNPLAVTARLIDAGDETTAGSNATNLVSKSFSTLSFNDQTGDFGFADVFVLFALNNYNLKASYSNQAVKLNWELLVASEEAEYAIERSENGQLYKTVITGTVHSGGGSISITNWDLNLPPGLPYLYYRLKLTSTSGKIQQSNAIKVKINTSVGDQVVVFPNPAKNKTTLSIPPSLVNKPIFITIANSSGQVLLKFTIANASKMEVVELSGLKQGSYFWRINTNKNRKAVFTGKLEIQ